MILKLTNASKEFDGKPLLINSRHILSVFEDVITLDDKTVEPVTTIYTVTQQSWSVRESVNYIHETINGISHDFTVLDTDLKIYDGLDMTDEVIDPEINLEGEAL